MFSVYQKAFTITELMVVLAIIAIVSATAIPNIQKTMATQKVKNATFELAQTIAKARSLTSQTRQTVSIFPASDSATYTNWNTAGSITNSLVNDDGLALLNQTKPSWYVVILGQKKVATTSIVDKDVTVKVSTNNQGVNSLNFTPFGGIVTNAGDPITTDIVFSVCLPKVQEKQITLKPSGVSRTETMEALCK